MVYGTQLSAALFAVSYGSHSRATTYVDQDGSISVRLTV